jgi:hypothetical protein
MLAYPGQSARRPAIPPPALEQSEHSESPQESPLGAAHHGPARARHPSDPSSVYAQLRARPAASAGLGLGLLLLVAASVLFLPEGVDWHAAFRPASLALLSGQSPYTVYGFYNAPWTLIPLVPFAILPEPVGRGMVATLGIVCFAYVGIRLGARPIVLGLFLLSPPVLHSMLNGNVDWLALLGAVVTPKLGLVLLATKPQIGIGVMVFLLVESWRQGGYRRVVSDVWPLAVLAVLSVVLYGPWPLRFGREVDLWWNASLWPGSIPFGLAFLAAALSRRRIQSALVASPLLSPYVLLHSWVGALAATLDSLPVAIAATLGLWGLVALRALGV